MHGPLFVLNRSLVSPSRIDLRKCRSRRLFSEKHFSGSSSDDTERRLSVCR